MARLNRSRFLSLLHLIVAVWACGQENENTNVGSREDALVARSFGWVWLDNPAGADPAAPAPTDEVVTPAGLTRVDAGVVYVFDTASGALHQRLIDSDPLDNDRFGIALATFHEEVLVGMSAWSKPGSVYLLEPASGILRHTFANFWGTVSWFGHSVTPDGIDVLIGTPYAGTYGAVHGFATWALP